MKIPANIMALLFIIVMISTLANGQLHELPNKTVEFEHVNDTASNATDNVGEENLDFELPTLDLLPVTSSGLELIPLGACEDPDIDLTNITYDCHNIDPERYSCINRCGSVLEPDLGGYCSCDPGCGIHKDCCRDYQLHCPIEHNISMNILNSVISEPIMDCTMFNQKQYKMVAQCLNGTRCEDLKRNWLDSIPVMDKTTWVTYLNKQCAACNDVEHVTPWPSKITCWKESFLKTLSSLKEIQSAIEDDLCFIEVEDNGHVCSDFISTCPVDCANEGLVEMCHNASVQFVQSSYIQMMYATYKNEYCLRCNVPYPGIQCTRCATCRKEITLPFLPLFSFSLLMDINPKKGLKIGFNVNGLNKEFECDENSNCTSACKEGYDYNNDTCIHVYTPQTFIVNISIQITGSMQHAFDLCVMMENHFLRNIDKLAAAAISYDIHYRENSLNATTSVRFRDNIQAVNNITGLEYHSMMFHTLKDEYNKHEEDTFFKFVKHIDFKSMCVDGMDSLTCFDWSNETVFYQRYYAEESESLGMSSETIMGIVTIVCLSISIICMIIRLILQIFVPVFHTFAGKLQFLLVLSLCLASLLKLLGPLTYRVPDLCTAMGVLTHYFYLVTFTFMSIIALDMYLVFRAGLSVAARGFKNLVIYSVVAFLLPVLVVGIAGILDSVAQGSIVRPDYGVPVCMITNRFSLLLFFACPLAIMIIFNITMFSLTVHNLRKSWDDAKHAKTKKNENHFDVYLKLFILMGFTWVFGFIAPFVEQDGLSYIFIILNASQGVFIFVASVCSRRVFRALGYMQKSTSKGSSYQTKSSSVRNSESVVAISK